MKHYSPIEICLWEPIFVLNTMVWYADCGFTWVFDNLDKPNENEMNYCPKCGKELEVAE